MKMDEIIMKEITKAAEVLDMSQDDVLAKFNDICTQNNIDMAKEELLMNIVEMQKLPIT